MNENLNRACRKTLNALRREFRRCSSMYLPLYHEKIFPWADDCSVRITDDEWAAFRSAHESDGNSDEWWEWDGPHPNPLWGDGYFQGRFTGCPDGLDEFVELAESAGLVLGECGFETAVSSNAYGDWLWFLHQLGFTNQIPLLRSDMTVWGLDSMPDPEEFDDLMTRWHMEDGDVRFPKHPLVFRLEQSVFVSSITAIEAILDPQGIITTNDPLDWAAFGATGPTDTADAPEEIATEPECDGAEEKSNDSAISSGNRFIIQDVCVKIEFAEKNESGTFKLSKGMSYWAEMLESPRRQFPPIDFLGGERHATVRDRRGQADAEVIADLVTSGVVADQEVGEPDPFAEVEQQKEFRKWMDNLNADRKEAVSVGNTKIVEEIDQKLREAKKLCRCCFNEAGKLRSLGKRSGKKNDWDRVCISLARSLAQIEIKMPLLAEHLRKSWVRKRYLAYEPEQNYVWQVRRPK